MNRVSRMSSPRLTSLNPRFINFFEAERVKSDLQEGTSSVAFPSLLFHGVRFLHPACTVPAPCPSLRAGPNLAVSDVCARACVTQVQI